MAALVVTAFLVGLAGGAHCVGMCGGIVAALALRGRDRVRAPSGRATAGPIATQLAYSIGRIASYSCAGALAGGFGGLALLYRGVLPGQLVLLVTANGLIVLLGLYLAGVHRGVLVLERAGSMLWHLLGRLGVRLAPARTAPGALAVGLAWGWIPCGLVYSVLATALVSGSAARGAAVMAAFGAGTLPNLLAAGLAADRLALIVRRPRFRLAAGIIVVLIGVVGLARVPFIAEHVRQGLHHH